MTYLSHFKEVWCLDTEFRAIEGERPEPICLCAREYLSGRVLQLWLENPSAYREPPFSVGPDTLFVAFFASAELGVFLALDWPLPVRILDLYAEFRLLTSGLPSPCGNTLLGALAAYGLPCMDALAKEDMRALAMRGGPFDPWERRELLNYCQEDADALVQLLPRMEHQIDLPRALLRGRYMAAVARMEAVGVPVDTEALETIRNHWNSIQGQLIAHVDQAYGVYDDGAFDTRRFERYLSNRGIPWPRLQSGCLALSEEVFDEQSQTYPELKPLHDLRVALGQLREWKLSVGSDRRNRYLISPFGARSSRNCPSNSKGIFGPAVWLRSLIRPEPGWALAYVDWEQQEFGIGAALSQDPAMQEAYRSGDPYLAFAKQAALIPSAGTKSTHKTERDLCKTCILGVQYGMGFESLAHRLNCPPARGRELLQLHRQTYRRYWQWSDAVQDFAMLHGYLETVCGWRVHVGHGVNPRSLRNFPLQANGAEMMRLASCLGTERGLRICAPVHDAFLIEVPVREISDAVEAMQTAMEEASELVLPGFPLRTDAVVVHWPERYVDSRGKRMWEVVCELITDMVGPVHGCNKTCAWDAHPPKSIYKSLNIYPLTDDSRPVRPPIPSGQFGPLFSVIEGEQETAETKEWREVLVPSSVAMVGDCRPIAREGASRGAMDVVPGRIDE